MVDVSTPSTLARAELLIMTRALGLPAGRFLGLGAIKYGRRVPDVRMPLPQLPRLSPKLILKAASCSSNAPGGAIDAVS
jgi:hypothetical protein